MFNIIEKKKQQIEELKKDIFKSMNSCELKDTLDKQHLESKLYLALSSVLINEEKVEYLNSICFEKITKTLLRNLVKTTDFEIFKSLVSVFERIVNTDNIYGTTGYFRSLLIAAFSDRTLKNQEKKLEYICKSAVLLNKENKCDKITNVDEFMWMANNFYASYIPKSWYIMSLFSDNKNIVENTYPDNSTTCVSGYDVRNYLNLSMAKKINLSRLDPGFMNEKFSTQLLSYIQNELSTGKIKKTLNEIINTKLSLEEKKQLILAPLGELKMSAFETMKKLYPGVMEKITFEDVLKMETHTFFIHAFLDDRKENEDYLEKRYLNLNSPDTGSNYQELLPLIKKYGIVLINNNNDIDTDTLLTNNVWKIVSKQQIDKQKKELKKIVPDTKRTNVKIQERL